MRAVANSGEIARVAANALAFLPARSTHKHARVTLGDGFIGVVATDGYTVGSDYVEADVTGEAVVYIDREGLAEIDKAGRADKKDMGSIEVFPGDCIKFTDSFSVEVAVPIYEPTGVWALVDGLFDRLDKATPSLPVVVALDPNLLMRFSKVKADKAERIADFIITDAETPILVKIGTTFRGVIMPVNRDVHSAVVGEDGLWNDDLDAA